MTTHRPALLQRVLVVIPLIVAACSSGEGDNSTDSEPSTSGTAAAPSTAAPSTAAPSTAADRPAANASIADVSVAVVGDEEIVYDWSEDRCRYEHQADLPALAFRDSGGMVNLIISSPTIHRMVGPELDSVAVDCTPVRESAVDPDPSRYDFQGWMGSLYTIDGETVHAVIHNEFHGDQASYADSRRDFSATPDAESWNYLGRVGDAEFELEFSEGEWRRSGTLCGVSSWGAHPDNDCEAIRRWTAPADGEVSVWTSVADAGLGGGDGVEVAIRHNGSVIWSRTLEEGDSDEIEAHQSVQVKADDELDFVVSSRGDAGWDATGFLVEINYGERPCTTRLRDQCLMMSLTYSRSTDGGATFQTPAAPDHLIAAVPQRYEPDVGSVGLWQPTNIVRHPTDGYYYMLAQIDIHDGRQNVTGECLLRTDDLGDPSSWRAWDGEDFGYEFVDPYRDDIADATSCASVMDSPVASLTYNTFLNRFVAVGENQFLQPRGVYVRTSADLLDWDLPELVIGEPNWTIGFATGFGTPFEAYPSILDPDSESMSFDTVGETAYLYYSRINTYDPLDFDMVRVPIRFETS